jgi:hypothetical protein
LSVTHEFVRGELRVRALDGGLDCCDPHEFKKESESEMERIDLIDREGQIFETISVPSGKRDAILFADRVFLPAGKGKYKQADFYRAPLPPIKPLTGT